MNYFLEQIKEIVGYEVSANMEVKNFDSITRIEIMVMLDEEYEITDNQFLSAHTINDLYDLTL